MSDEQIAFGVEQLKALKVLDGGDAATMGIGIMTEARWKATYDLTVSSGLLKPEVDSRAGVRGCLVNGLQLSMLQAPVGANRVGAARFPISNPPHASPV